MKVAVILVALLFVGTDWKLAHAEEMGEVRKLSDVKFGPLPGMPSCITLQPESGDPTQGPFILIFKGTAGCRIPWHWHSTTENIMIIKGAARVEMKGSEKGEVLGSGGFAMMPSKHQHQFTCTEACLAFLSSDGIFDIHYVDANGKEISPEVALKK